MSSLLQTYYIKDYLWQNGIYYLLTSCTIMLALDASFSCKMLSHSTGSIILDDWLQKNGAAVNAIDAWLFIREACTLLKAVLNLSSALM